MTVAAPSLRQVTIPACDTHEGVHKVTVNLRWICPKCGGPRGEIAPARSYDGSRILFCDGWTNPCGHVDYYPDVRAEVAAYAGADSEAGANAHPPAEASGDLPHAD